MGRMFSGTTNGKRKSLGHGDTCFDRTGVPQRILEPVAGAMPSLPSLPLKQLRPTRELENWIHSGQSTLYS